MSITRLIVISLSLIGIFHTPSRGQVVVRPAEVNYDTLGPGKYSSVISIANLSKDSLVAEVTVSCQCVTLAKTGIYLEPASASSLEFQVDATSYEGPQRKDIFIHILSPQDTIVDVPLRFVGLTPLIAHLKSGILQDIPSGDSRNDTLMIENRSGKEIVLGPMKADEAVMEVKIPRMDGTVLGPGEHLLLPITLHPKKSGFATAIFQLRTSSPLQPTFLFAVHNRAASVVR